jgi:hypothetical protein
MVRIPGKVLSVFRRKVTNGRTTGGPVTDGRTIEDGDTDGRTSVNLSARRSRLGELFGTIAHLYQCVLTITFVPNCAHILSSYA